MLHLGGGQYTSSLNGMFVIALGELVASALNGMYFLHVIKIVASQSDFSNLFCPLNVKRNQLETEAEHCLQTKL